MNKKILIFALLISIVLAVLSAFAGRYFNKQEISADLVANIQTKPAVSSTIPEEENVEAEQIVVLNNSIITSFEDDRENIIRNFKWLEKASDAATLVEYRLLTDELNSCADADFTCLDKARFALDDLAKTQSGSFAF